MVLACGVLIPERVTVEAGLGVLPHDRHVQRNSPQAFRPNTDLSPRDLLEVGTKMDDLLKPKRLA